MGRPEIFMEQNSAVSRFLDKPATGIVGCRTTTHKRRTSGRAWSVDVKTYYSAGKLQGQY